MVKKRPGGKKPAGPRVRRIGRTLVELNDPSDRPLLLRQLPEPTAQHLATGNPLSQEKLHAGKRKK